MLETILVLNTGSSSVKASLILSNRKSGKEKNGILEEQQEGASQQRLATAHAERLLTKESIIHISISVAATESLLKETRRENSSFGKTHAQIDGSLEFTSRSTSRHWTKQAPALNDSTMTVDPPIITTKETVKIIQLSIPNLTHETAIQTIIDSIQSYNADLISSVIAVGHRVVHGGTTLNQSIIVNDDVFKSIESVSHLAPLHNPPNLQGIKIARSEFPTIPSIAVFDTAFHSTMPPHAYQYPLPSEYINQEIRKYGFHGTSVQYVSQVATRILNDCFHKNDRTNSYSSNGDDCKDEPHRMVVCHLGNGASVTAVVDGKSVDTTMGFTPLSGIMMGTRSGSIDPAIVPFAANKLDKLVEEVIYDLNHNSGLKGVSKGDHDMRSIIERSESGDKDAKLALNMFVYILSKHIAAMIVACGGAIDALVFTAGIGENSALIRKATLDKVGIFLGGVQLDDDLNKRQGYGNDGIVNKNKDDKPLILVLHTDEEAMISKECERILKENNFIV